MGRKKKGVYSEPKKVVSINFDESVLNALEKRVKLSNQNISAIVNMVCRRHIMTDELYYLEMEKYHREKAEGFRFKRDQINIKDECR